MDDVQDIDLEERWTSPCTSTLLHMTLYANDNIVQCNNDFQGTWVGFNGDFDFKGKIFCQRDHAREVLIHHQPARVAASSTPKQPRAAPTQPIQSAQPADEPAAPGDVQPVAAPAPQPRQNSPTALIRVQPSAGGDAAQQTPAEPVKAATEVSHETAASPPPVAVPAAAAAEPGSAVSTPRGGVDSASVTPTRQRPASKRLNKSGSEKRRNLARPAKPGQKKLPLASSLEPTPRGPSTNPPPPVDAGQKG